MSYNYITGIETEIEAEREYYDFLEISLTSALCSRPLDTCLDKTTFTYSQNEAQIFNLNDFAKNNNIYDSITAKITIQI